MTKAPDALRTFASHLFAVLANPRRLDIVYLLRTREHRVSELATALGLAQAATSQHLAVLRSAGVVEARRDANYVWYRLAVPSLVPAIDAFMKAVCDVIRCQEDQLRPVLHAMRAARVPGVNA